MITGISLIIFPELAITGFHRGIKEQTQPALITSALEKIALQCLACKTLAFVGHPLINKHKVFNAYSLINETGNIELTWKKVGLTESEATFFEPGADIPVLNHRLGTFSAYFCREASDVDWVVSQLASQSPSYVMWPSYIGAPQGNVNRTDGNYDLSSQYIAKKLATNIVQCNWPCSLNSTESSGLGGSKIFSSNGSIIAQLPLDECCVGVFDTNNQSLIIRRQFNVA